MARIGSVSVALLLVVSLLLPLASFAATGDASGIATLNGKKIELKYAFARHEKGWDEADAWRLVITDRAVSRSLLADDSRLHKAVERGELSAVVLRFDASREVEGIEIHSPLLEKRSLPISVTESAVTIAGFDDSSIRGEVLTNRLQDFFDDTGELVVSFHAVIGSDGRYGESAAAQRELEAKAPKLADGAAAGTLRLDGKEVQLRHARAKRAPNAFDDTKQDVVLYLTDRPIDDAVLTTHRAMYDAVEKGLRGLVVKIDESETPYHMELLDRAASLQLSGTGIFNFDVVRFEPDRVDARFYTEEEETFGGDTRYAYDVSFRAQVQEVVDPRDAGVDASTGRKLPPDGGAPGKAFLAMDRAIRKGSIGEIARHASAEAPSPFEGSAEEQKEMLELLQMMHPRNVTIVEGWESGDRATLHVVGDDPMEEGVKAKGTVQMVREKGEWKVLSQKWRS